MLVPMNVRIGLMGRYFCQKKSKPQPCLGYVLNPEWHFQDIDYLSRFVVNPPNSKLWNKCFVSIRTLTMVLRWAKCQDWKGGSWTNKKYDGKNVACLRSMFQGWYGQNSCVLF